VKLSVIKKAVFCCALGLIAQAAAADNLVGDAVILRALDKVTARTLDLTVPIDGAVKYGTLEITPRKCLKRPPEETPETSTFLEIRETKPQEETLLLFSGWMFASSPALNALEHPVYDVWVIDCNIPEDGVSNGKE